MTRRLLPSLGGVCAHAVLLSGALLMLAPFLWMALTSFKPAAEIFTSELQLLPSRFTLHNYVEALSASPILRFLLNGIVVCGGILALQLAVAIPCGYALAKLEFRGRSALFGLVLLGLLIPVQVPALPLYLGLARLGLLDSYPALVLPWAVSAFAIFLFRQVFRRFPDEIVDAARIDGFGEIAIAFRIALPSAWPAVAAFSIFSVVAHWNDLYWPMVVVTSTELMTPPLGIAYFREGGGVDGNVGALMAGGVIITAPLVVAFLFAQRRFVQGLAFTGIR